MGARFEYEFRQLTFPPRATRAEMRQRLTEHAEFDDWELVRTALYLGGVRKVTLRRKIIRVQRAESLFLG